MWLKTIFFQKIQFIYDELILEISCSLINNISHKIETNISSKVNVYKLSPEQPVARGYDPHFLFFQLHFVCTLFFRYSLLVAPILFLLSCTFHLPFR